MLFMRETKLKWAQFYFVFYSFPIKNEMNFDKVAMLKLLKRLFSS